MDASYKISQVMNLTESTMLDCYYIVSQSWPNEADGVYYALRKKVNNPDSQMFIASDTAGIIRGFIAGHMSDKNNEAKIDWLFVEGRHGRHGIGGMLVRAYSEYCRARGVGLLNVQPARTVQAKQFYTKQGFIPSGFILWAKDLGR